MQRESMGIMAGVAPIQGYREGGSAAPDYTPKFLRDEQPEEDSMGRMLFELFVVDPDDPVDVGMASASAAMMVGGVTAPAAIATQLARMGYKGKKLYNLINKVESLSKPKKENAGIISKAMAPVTATYGASQTGRLVGEIPEIVEAAGGIGDLARDSAIRGIAQLSDGGFLGGLMALLPKRAETAGKILERAIDAGRATFDDIVDAFKRGEIDEKQLTDLNKKLPEGDQGRLVQPGQRLDRQDGTISKVEPDRTGTGVLEGAAGKKTTTPKMTAEDISAPPSSKVVEPPKPVEAPKTTVTDEAADAVKQPITQRVRQSVPGQVVSGALKPITSPIRVGAPVAVGAYALSQAIESGKIQEAMNMAMNDPRVKSLIDAGRPAYDAVKQFFGPLAEAIFPDTGERVELTDSVMEQVDTNKDGRISKEESAAIKKRADEAAKKEKQGTEQKETETGTPKPVPSGLAKFFKKFDDPRLQYQLARASQPTEGFVPRNFFSDMVLAGAEYDQLQGKDETALMQNYEFLKQAGKSDDEIFDLLLSKDTQSDLMERYQDTVLSLFTSASENAANVGADTDELLKKAQADAAKIIFGTSTAAPKDNEVIATVDIE
tara:strand:+ start:1 stop:1815 length:1815 start_codon:yes stop_codon:yes gene_type:complete